MLEKDFLKYCEDELERLSQLVEDYDKDSTLDVEYVDGILKITIVATHKTYVINRNSGNRKIWYSSPISGADYFSFDELKGLWLNSAGKELKDKLFEELSL